MEGLFIVGLLSFLLGHVAYILAFLQDSRKLFAGKALIAYAYGADHVCRASYGPANWERWQFPWRPTSLAICTMLSPRFQPARRPWHQAALGPGRSDRLGAVTISDTSFSLLQCSFTPLPLYHSSSCSPTGRASSASPCRPGGLQSRSRRRRSAELDLSCPFMRHRSEGPVSPELDGLWPPIPTFRRSCTSPSAALTCAWASAAALRSTIQSQRRVFDAIGSRLPDFASMMFVLAPTVLPGGVADKIDSIVPAQPRPSPNGCPGCAYSGPTNPLQLRKNCRIALRGTMSMALTGQLPLAAVSNTCPRTFALTVASTTRPTGHQSRRRCCR